MSKISSLRSAVGNTWVRNLKERKMVAHLSHLMGEGMKKERLDVTMDVKVKISALWVGLMVLFLYADLFSFYRPGVIESIIDGQMGFVEVSQWTLFFAALLMAIPTGMIILTVTLKAGINRWVNIIIGSLYVAVEIGNIIGEDWAFYVMLGIMELVVTICLIVYAVRWPSVQK